MQAIHGIIQAIAEHQAKQHKDSTIARLNYMFPFS